MTKMSFRRSGLFALAAIAMLSAALPAAAQQPSASAIANAKTILAAKNTQNIYEPVLIGVIERAKVTLIQANLNLQQPLKEVAEQLAKEFADRGNAVGNELAKRYAAAFTEQELKDLVAFYTSPLGRKTIETEPRVLQDSMIYMEEWADKLSEEVLTRFRQEMKKRGHDI